MKKVMATILVLAGLAASVFGVIKAFQFFHSWSVAIYLSLFVFLPLVGILGSIGNGLEAFKNSARTLASVAAGLVITTVVYKLWLHNWIWACVAGAVLPGVLMVALQWKQSTAITMSNQAGQLLQKHEFQDALQLSTAAREIYVSRGNRDGMAATSFQMGAAYAGLGDNLRAVRYLNNALGLYRSLGNAESVQNVEGHLRALAARGADTSAGAIAEEEPPVWWDWGFALSSLLACALLAALFALWAPESLTVSLPVLGSLAGLLFVCLIGNYLVSAKILQQDHKHRGPGPLWAFNLLFVLFVVAFAVWMLRQGIFAVEDFPPSLAAFLQRGLQLIAPLSTTVLMGIGIVLGLLLLLLLIPGNLLQNIAGNVGSTDAIESQAISQAKRYMADKEWGRALTQLIRIDLTRDRDTEDKTRILFALAFVHYMTDHEGGAEQYLSELFELNPNHQAGLFLAGYLTLRKNKLDDAEQYYRRLATANAAYAPAGPSAGDARYYLSLVLYRKALACMETDPDQSAQLLSEVGRLGSLDTYVANALVRVHLYRCVQFTRQRQWQEASAEVELAEKKRAALGTAPDAKEETAKLQGLCAAARSLISFRREEYGSAIRHLGLAQEAVKELSVQKPLMKGGASFFEDLINAMLAQQAAAGRLQPAFPRDLSFLRGIAHLHELGEALQHATKADWRSAVAQMEKDFEQSLAAAPSFMEGRAMLGLLYCYFSEDPAEQAKGLEMLKSVQERVGSRFVGQTVKEIEGNAKRRVDAQKAYFDMLQQYMQFSNVPLQQRMALREKVLAQMKETGRDQEFAGQGGLEVETEREHEPSVQEYMARSALLKEKITQLMELDKHGKLPAGDKDRIQQLIDALNEHNQELKKRVDDITGIERDLLLAAQKYM